LLFAVLLCLCKSKNPVKEIKDPIFVQKQQYNITWEGLLDSPWPMHQHDPQHTGRSPYIGPQVGEVLWSYDMGQEVFSTPLIDNIGNIYIGSYSMNFVALNPSGQLLWSFPLDGQNYISTPLIDAHKNIYITPNGSSFLYSITTSKEINWIVEVPGIDFYSFNISKDGRTLYAIGFTEETINHPVGHLFAINSTDGQVQWQHHFTEEQGVWGEPAIGPDQTIYCTSHTGKRVYAINPDGKLKWEFFIEKSTASSLATSSPSIDSDGNIYVNNSSRILCIDPNGSEKWHFDKIDFWARNHPPTIAGDGTIYSVFGSRRPQLIAFDSIGQVKWKTETDESTGDIVCAPVVDSEGTVYLGLMPGYHEQSINFMAVNSNGTIKFKLALFASDGRIPGISLPPSLSAEGIAYVGLERPMGTLVYAIK